MISGTDDKFGAAVHARVKREREAKSACSDLLPCPFCGLSANFILKQDHTGSKWDVGCDGVGCLMEDGADWFWDSQDEAREKWNRRAG